MLVYKLNIACKSNEKHAIIKLNISLLNFNNRGEIFMEKYYILVEGVTDKEILDFYIEQAYPELKELLYIVPFESPKRIGGKDYISHMIKFIVHLEEKHKNIIAVFDNDTEGIYAKEMLIKELERSNINMKKNFSHIKILSYPENDFLKKYPVYNTNVRSSVLIENDDINRRAGAIELYLPHSMLMNDRTGELHPIRWKSFNEKVSKYQGVFVDKTKNEIMKKFRTYKSDIKNNETSFDKNNWSNCDLIIKLLLKEINMRG